MFILNGLCLFNIIQAYVFVGSLLCPSMVKFLTIKTLNGPLVRFFLIVANISNRDVMSFTRKNTFSIFNVYHILNFASILPTEAIHVIPISRRLLPFS